MTDINMLDKSIIENLESKIKEWFIEEYDVKNAKGRVTATSFSGKELFERYRNITKVAYTDNYISALCLRLTQSGRPTYPIAGIPKYEGLRSPIEDKDVTAVLYIDKIINDSMEDSLKYICDNYKG